MTDCLFPAPTRPYDLSWEQKTVWCFLFGTMLFVAITGNCIVLWIVLGKRIISYFICNLSIHINVLNEITFYIQGLQVNLN